ncbi:MAG: hypothetical protein AABY27_04255 [Pseudomonadota bacterium]
MASLKTSIARAHSHLDGEHQKKAIDYYQQSIQICKQLKSEQNIAVNLQELIAAYKKLNDATDVSSYAFNILTLEKAKISKEELLENAKLLKETAKIFSAKQDFLTTVELQSKAFDILKEQHAELSLLKDACYDIALTYLYINEDEHYKRMAECNNMIYSGGENSAYAVKDEF